MPETELFDVIEDREQLVVMALGAAKMVGGADDELLADLAYSVVDAKCDADQQPATRFDPQVLIAIITAMMELVKNCRDPEKAAEKLQRHPNGFLTRPYRKAIRLAYESKKETKADAESWTDASVRALVETRNGRLGRLIARAKQR